MLRCPYLTDLHILRDRPYLTDLHILRDRGHFNVPSEVGSDVLSQDILENI